MPDLSLDRHVFGSSASAYDTAWETYGWTPALEGVRANRLEEAVPWGTHMARSSDPARLSGRVPDVLAPDNVDRLGSAFLPLDGRFGWSLWGAVGSEPVGSEWRVLTHTLLAREDELRAIGVHPGGLLHEGSAWLGELLDPDAFREPIPLAPLRLDAGPDVVGLFQARRHDELRRLRDRAAAALGAETLESTLAHAFEALAGVSAGPRGHVAVRIEDDGFPGRVLVRLLWLALPREDRLRTFYVTDQRKAERPPAQILGLPAADWGRFVPEDTWLVGESDPTGPPSPGRAQWARLLARSDRWRDFVALERRADARGWSLVHRDDLRGPALHVRWSRGWRTGGPELRAVSELVAIEEGQRRGGRWHAAGALLGRAMLAELGAGGGGRDAVADRGLGVVRAAPVAAWPAVLRGAVRTLRRGGTEALALAGLLRFRSAELGDEALAREIRRVADRESDALRALLAEPSGALAVVEGAMPAAATGDPVGRELVLLGAPDVAWARGGAAAVAARVEPGTADEVVADLLLRLSEEGVGDDGVVAAGRALLPVTGEAGVTAVVAGARSAPLGFLALEHAGRMHGREAEGATATLVDRLAAATPPEVEPAPWSRLISEAPAAWLGRDRVLTAITRALGAGRDPLRAPVPDRGPGSRPHMAAVAARRVLERAGATGLTEAQALAVLRLLWLEGDGGTLRWLVSSHRGSAVPVLAQLLVAPAPVPLALDVRDALLRALDEGAPVRGVEAWRAGLAAHAPAVAERLSGHGRPSPRVFVGNGG